MPCLRVQPGTLLAHLENRPGVSEARMCLFEALGQVTIVGVDAEKSDTLRVILQANNSPERCR
jgi:hypothetical protein